MDNEYENHTCPVCKTNFLVSKMYVVQERRRSGSRYYNCNTEFLYCVNCWIDCFNYMDIPLDYKESMYERYGKDVTERAIVSKGL
jgi:hypothetical protein